MSHIHHIGGGASAAAEYREYLARLGARRRGDGEAGGAEKKELRTFDSAIDPDRDPEPEDREEEETEEGAAEEGKSGSGDEPATDSEGEAGWSVKV